MKQSERLLMDAESKLRIIEGYQSDVDLRARQIDKLQQEIRSFEELLHKEQMSYDEVVKQAQQEQQKEDDDEERKRKQQIALNAAQSMASTDT